MPTAYALQYTAGEPLIYSSVLWRGGPFEYNGAIYVLGEGSTLGNAFLRVAKSTDGGVTWTILDTANEPATTGISGGHGLDCVRRANVLNCLCMNTGTFAFRLVDFDLATETWGAAIDGGPIPSVFGGSRANPSIFEVNAAASRKIIAYNVDNGGIPTDIAFVVYAGSWGSPITIANDSRQIRSIAIDASGRVHLETFTTANVYEEYILDSSNTLTGPFAMYGPTSNAIGDAGPGYYDAATDTLIFPILEVGTNGIQASLLKGTPSSAPVWTQDIAGQSGPFLDWTHSYYVPASNPYIVLAEDGGSPDDPVVYLQKVSGTWGLRVQVYDPRTDPAVPALEPSFGAYGSFRPIAALLASGALGVVQGFPAVGLFASNIAYFISFTPCPTGGGSGNLYFAH